MVYKYICLDSAAIISGCVMNLPTAAEKIVTIQEVLDEIRDEKARNLLAALPFEISVMRPSPESMKDVINFAHKTGDYAALSVTDMKLIALCHSLEVSINGTANIRSEPQRAITKSIPKKKKEKKSPITSHKPPSPIEVPRLSTGDLPDSSDVLCSCGVPDFPDKKAELVADKNTETMLPNDDYVYGECQDDPDTTSSYEDDNSSSRSCDENDDESIPATVLPDDCDPSTEGPEECVQRFVTTNEPCTASGSIDSNGQGVASIVSPSTGPLPQNDASQQPHQHVSRILNKSNFNSDSSTFEDDGENWITVENIRSHQAQGQAAIKLSSQNSSRSVDVACMTADFAMQNVLMQMGLHVSSIDGKIIRSVKSWVLRCNGCFKIHYDMQRLFCSSCGLNYLSKIGCHVDSKSGELKLHLKKNFQHNIRGMIYSLPAPGPSAGRLQDRFQGDLLLREDQLLTGVWRQRAAKVKKNIASAFGEFITDDVGVTINKGARVVVGYGSKNPNAAKGRERRGKKKH